MVGSTWMKAGFEGTCRGLRKVETEESSRFDKQFACFTVSLFNAEETIDEMT